MSKKKHMSAEKWIDKIIKQMEIGNKTAKDFIVISKKRHKQLLESEMRNKSLRKEIYALEEHILKTGV